MFVYLHGLGCLVIVVQSSFLLGMLLLFIVFDLGFLVVFVACFVSYCLLLFVCSLWLLFFVSLVVVVDFGS